MTGETPIDLDHDGEDDFSGGMGNPTITVTLVLVRICLAIFGLLANTITGVVLTNKKLWNPTSMLLLSLVAYDAIFLLATLPPILSGFIQINSMEDFSTIIGICLPLRFMAQMGSIYTTVTVTIERFLIVFRPLKARAFCTFGKIRRVIFAIFIFCVLFNIPRCFFIKILWSYTGPNFNMTENSTIPSLSVEQTTVASAAVANNGSPEHTEAAANESLIQMMEYDEEKAYYNWLYIRVYELYVSSVFFYLLPYMLIPVMNVQLLIAIKKRRDETRRISVKNEHQLRYSKPTDLEDGLTMIVLGITVCFFICALIPAIYNLIRIADVPQTDAVYYLLVASDTMLCINASTDFFFYCLLGRKFRNIFLHIFCPKKFLKKSRTLNSSHRKASHRTSDTCYHSV